MLSQSRLSDMPKRLPIEAHLKGTYLYGGIARDHFGHFLVESTPRLWALTAETPQIDGIVFTRLPQSPQTKLSNAALNLLKEIAPDVPLELASVATRVDRLVLAEPGFGHGDLIAGTQEYHAFMRACFENARPGPHRKVYLSRANYAGIGRCVENEPALIAHLEAAGYHIAAPERMSLPAQASLFKGATHIVGGDGSAFHFAPMVIAATTQAAIFMRRNRPEVLDLLARQMRAFCGVSPVLIDPRVRKDPIPGAPVDLDMDQLLDALRKDGFLD